MRIAVSIGDIAGIGPEVVLRALREPLEGAEVVVYGDPGALAREAEILDQVLEGGSRFEERFERLDGDEDAPGEGRVGVVDVCPDLETDGVEKGVGDEVSAELQWHAFDRAVAAVREDRADAVVTAPWNKSLFGILGEPALGHTDVLDDHFPGAQPVMMLAGPRLRVSLVTTHVPLRRVADRLTGERLREVVRTTVGGLRRRFGIDAPAVAVCGLNPHAGEGGAMGSEERDLIEPTIEELRDEFEPSVDLTGPLPADTLFTRYREGGTPWDAVVCMYHDQGLIPLKLTHFGRSANVTLGLPIVRTSVDHGTAYDIAGKGVADAGSMRYALQLAARQSRLAGRRRRD